MKIDGVYLHMLGFNLATRDLYFMILVEVFTNHILAETHFTNHRVNITQDYGLKTSKQGPNYLTLTKFEKHSY